MSRRLFRLAFDRPHDRRPRQLGDVYPFKLPVFAVRRVPPLLQLALSVALDDANLVLSRLVQERATGICTVGQNRELGARSAALIRAMPRIPSKERRRVRARPKPKTLDTLRRSARRGPKRVP